MKEDTMKQRSKKDDAAGEEVGPLATARSVVAGLAKRLEDTRVANRREARPVRIWKRDELEEPLGGPPKIHRTGQ
jgi:hypothetical protein